MPKTSSKVFFPNSFSSVFSAASANKQRLGRRSLRDEQHFFKIVSGALFFLTLTAAIERYRREAVVKVQAQQRFSLPLQYECSSLKVSLDPTRGTQVRRRRLHPKVFAFAFIRVCGHHWRLRPPWFYSVTCSDKQGIFYLFIYCLLLKMKLLLFYHC